jgi:ADP-ribosylglycohydrolase
MDRNLQDNFTGCLLGGACGDALGWPVEFKSWDVIRRDFGPMGVTTMIPGEGGLFEITDDTQMTLFTAEGLLRAWATSRHHGGAPDFRRGLESSYLSWLSTQGEKPVDIDHGWLHGIEELHRQRAPGSTCLSALGNIHANQNVIAANDSKGCGGVMRTAPAGLLAARINSGDDAGTVRMAFELGCMAAALTHGHPSGYYPAGCLAAVIATIICGGEIRDGVEAGLGFLEGRAGSSETMAALTRSVELWEMGVEPSPETIESLGGGWVGEEALAIGIFCSLAAEGDFPSGLRLAVNHTGDSDSTGSITGNILGAMLGIDGIPLPWLERLELMDVITRVGKDLFTAFEGSGRWLGDYPPLT